MVSATRSANAICHLVEGWACRFSTLSNDQQAIVDVYLPGDIIGLDATSRTRTLEGVITLTSILTETIDREQVLTDMTTFRSTAVYIAWELGRQQRRTERHVAAISSLDARGRLATMALDFYTRLSRRQPSNGSAYYLPLTQAHIAAYLGLTVAHVNRILRSLRDEQIVSLERHCMTILDVNRLNTLAQKGLQPGAGFEERVLNRADRRTEGQFPDYGGFPAAKLPDSGFE